MTATGTTAPGGSEGETIIGATSCDAMVDGLGFDTDVDLDFAGSAFSLRIMTGDGRVYEFRAPEQPGGLPGFALRRMPVAMFMPRVASDSGFLRNRRQSRRTACCAASVDSMPLRVDRQPMEGL